MLILQLEVELARASRLHCRRDGVFNDNLDDPDDQWTLAVVTAASTNRFRQASSSLVSRS